jgi:hypothetical protein
MSGLISFYILDKFNYSKNVFIGISQRALFLFIFLFIFILFGLIVFFAFAAFAIYFDFIPIIEHNSMDDGMNITSSSSSSTSIIKDILSVVESTEANNSTYEFKIDKEQLDKVVISCISTINTFVEQVLPNIAAAAAAGSVGSAVVKATANISLGVRMLAI